MVLFVGFKNIKVVFLIFFRLLLPAYKDASVVLFVPVRHFIVCLFPRHDWNFLYIGVDDLELV